MGANWAEDWRLLVAVVSGLVFFGCTFNTLVSRMANRLEGYTSLLVVAGALVTLAGVALIDLKAALLCLIAFAASGLPMVIGDIARAVKARDKSIERIKKEISATNFANITNKHEEFERELDDAS